MLDILSSSRSILRLEKGFAPFADPVYNTAGFVELFLTERSVDSIIFGEVIGEITPENSDEFHTNVQLVE